MSAEIINLCSSDDESPLQPPPVRAPVRNTVVQDLRKRLRDSEQARRALSEEQTKLNETTSKLEEELAETRRQLAELEANQQDTPSLMESHQSSTEIIRCLNNDLEGMTRLSVENYSKFQNAHRLIGDYKSVIEALWSAVECPVCFEPIWEPAAYMCGHIVCQGCTTAACAHCRAPSPGVIKVYAIRDIVRTIAPLAENLQSPKKPRR